MRDSTIMMKKDFFLTEEVGFRILCRMTENGIIHEYFTIYNKMGEPIRGDLRSQRSLEEKPIIIVCHSFMAFKDWGFFPYVADSFANNGLVSVTFNFSHNGVVGDEDRITDYKKFENNTISKEIEDIGVVIDAIWDGQIGAGDIDRSKIILLGHSRGGGISILKASKDERVKGLVTWSSISYFDRWAQHQKARWRKLGYLPLARDTSISPLRLGIDLLNDVEENRKKLNILDATANIRIPWLIIHGKTDITVPLAEAELLYKTSNCSLKEFILLDKVGHIYNASSKDEDNYQTLNKIIEITLQWIQQNIQ
ncbi:MAG: hypothetical protein QME52_08435 [Bacteroidota bacterium]|nr:hypothetical protein [Bacteroidota bacterium]